MPDDIVIEIIFTVKLIKENIKINPEKILDVKWFKIDDILNNMDSELRLLNFIKQPIKNMVENKVGSIDIVNIL